MKNLKNLVSLLILFCLSNSVLSAAAPFATTSLENELSFEFPVDKPLFEHVSICRLQLQVKTNSFEGAQTDSPVHVQLNYTDKPFFLNLSHNDRERNQTDTYDLVFRKINKIKDIYRINLVINGNDGWNIRELSLLVNGIKIYSKSYGSKGYWLDGNHKNRSKRLSITKRTMAQHPNFRYNSKTNNIYRGPTMVSKAMLDDLVESAVGNSLGRIKKITWGKKQGKAFIDSKRINNNTLRYDLDLSYEINNAPNVEIDVDFDLVFICKNGVIQTEVKNYKQKAYGTMKYLVDTMAKLKTTLYASCTKIKDIKGKVICYSGVWLAGQLLDFNFEYEGAGSPGSVGLAKECTGALKLDGQGNLILGKKKGLTTNKRNAAYNVKAKRGI